MKPSSFVLWRRGTESLYCGVFEWSQAFFCNSKHFFSRWPQNILTRLFYKKKIFFFSLFSYTSGLILLVIPFNLQKRKREGHSLSCITGSCNRPISGCFNGAQMRGKWAVEVRVHTLVWLQCKHKLKHTHTVDNLSHATVLRPLSLLKKTRCCTTGDIKLV